MQPLQNFQRGFTLVEMIVVMVITSILSGVIALMIKGPVQGYLDSARRADMTDIAETAMSRITRDLRLALPNSTRVSNGAYASTCSGTEICFLEFIPTTGGGRYSEYAFNGTSFIVLGPMPPFSGSSSSIVIDNLIASSISGTSSVYSGYNVAPLASFPGSSSSVTLSGAVSATSPRDHFQVISTPVTYVCNPVTGALTLTRYWGYPIQPAQPYSVATLNGLAGVQSGVLASNVTTCKFLLQLSNNSLQLKNSLVTIQLTISESGVAESGESISLYDTAYVANVP